MGLGKFCYLMIGIDLVCLEAVPRHSLRKCSFFTEAGIIQCTPVGIRAIPTAKGRFAVGIGIREFKNQLYTGSSYLPGLASYAL